MVVYGTQYKKLSWELQERKHTMSVSKREKMSLDQWALIRTITSWCQDSEQMCERVWKDITILSLSQENAK